MFNKKLIILVLLLSVIFIADIFIPLWLPIIFSLLLICLLHKTERKLLFILLIALWIRIIFAIGYNSYLSTKSVFDTERRNFNNEREGILLFGGDGEFQAGHAWWVYVLNLNKDLKKHDLMWKKGFFSDIWTYQELVLKNKYVPMNHFQVGFYTYMIAVLYSYFGYLPVIINFINSILGVLAGYFIYRVSLDLFKDKRVAYLSLILALYYPTLFIWSALTKLKMTDIIFLASLFLFSCTQLFYKKKWIYLPLLILVILSGDLFMKDITSILFSVFVLSYLFVRSKDKTAKIFFTLGIVCFLIKAGTFLHLFKTIVNYGITRHIGMIHTGGTVYKLLDGKFYIGDPASRIAALKFLDYLIYYLKAMFHFILEPLPQSISTKNILLFYPQQILWYFLLFFAFIGNLFALRYFRKETLLLLVYLIVTTSAFALASGNVGAAARHRDFITPICFIFSSLGILHALGFNIKLNSDKTKLQL